MKKLTQIILFIFIGLAWVPALASSPMANSCQGFQYSKSSPADREELLSEIKTSITEDLSGAISNLSAFHRNLRSCNDPACHVFVEQFLTRTKEQVRLAKYARAIATRGLGIFSYTRSPRTMKSFVLRVERNALDPRKVLNFDIPGFTFTDEEKEEAFDLWWKTFVPIAKQRGPGVNVRDIFKETQEFFAAANNELMSLNPMLGYIDESDLESPQAFIDAFEKIVDYNHEFLGQIEKFKTHHPNSIGSYIKILVTDHEMGLVNFRNQADMLISTLDTREDKNEMCSAWQDLKKQQGIRIASSIGVGLGTAIVCGVGSLSGIGTVAAVAACGPAFIDSFVGASRGYKDARTAFLGRFAGIEVDQAGAFTDSIVSLENSQILERRGVTVLVVNTFALLPVLKVLKQAKAASDAAKAGTTRVQPKIKDFLILPASDSSVSMTELQAARIAYLFIAGKGFDFFNQEFPLIIQEMKSSNWP